MKHQLKIVIGISLLGFLSFKLCSDDKIVENPVSLEESAHQLLRAIHSKEIEKIEKFVPEFGLVDDDQNISKQLVVEELKNPSSNLYKQLFSQDTKCKESLINYVSPFTFYEIYGEDYQVNVRLITESNHDIFGVYILPISANSSCNYQLWHSTFIRVRSKFYLYGNFFQ